MAKFWKCTQCSKLYMQGFLARLSDGDHARCENCDSTELENTRTTGHHHRLLDALR